MARGWVMPFARPWRPAGFVSTLLLAGSLLGILPTRSAAQEGRYVPFDQNAPVGRIGLWVGQIGKGLAGVLQPVQVVLPTKG